MNERWADGGPDMHSVQLVPRRQGTLPLTVQLNQGGEGSNQANVAAVGSLENAAQQLRTGNLLAVVSDMDAAINTCTSGGSCQVISCRRPNLRGKTLYS